MGKTRAKARVFCIIEHCNQLALIGAAVCRDHLHPVMLQGEIERLRTTRVESELQFLLTRFPEARALLENLAALANRADPLKGSQVAVTARSRGHNLTDGIVALGDHILIPGYAASVRKDEGRLGAAVAVVAGAKRKLDRMLDPNEDDTRDDRPRCGRRSCDGPNVRQPVNIRFCGFCGRDMREKGGCLMNVQTEIHAIYRGPPRKGWKPGYCYQIQLRPIGGLQIHVGTIASHNDRMGNGDPTPIRLRTLRRFLDWFTPLNALAFGYSDPRIPKDTIYLYDPYDPAHIPFGPVDGAG